MVRIERMIHVEPSDAPYVLVIECATERRKEAVWTAETFLEIERLLRRSADEGKGATDGTAGAGV